MQPIPFARSWVLPGLLLLGSQQSLAGGILLYEVATDNAGLANAGAAARAQGPSTIASNPAGLGYLEGTQITAGAQVLYGDLTFDEDSATTGTGEGSGNVLDPMPGVSFFASHRLDEHWSIGFGTYGDFGLAEDYGDDWTGRYFVQNASIAGLSMVPSVAYRFNDEWALGIGLRAMYGMLTSEAAINRAPFGLMDRSDGQFKYEDNVWGYGTNLGLIYEPRSGTRIGLAYTSEIDLDFEDHLKVEGTGPLLDPLDGVELELDTQVPQTLTLSLYQQLDPRWALLATANWQDWSEFGEIGVEVDTSLDRATTRSINADYKDTYQLALGAQYQATETLLWSVGMAYDSSAVSDSDRTFTVPMGAAWRLATGATWALDKDTDLNVSWVLIWLDDMSIDQRKSLSGDRTSGEFEDAWLQAISGNMTWRF